MNKVKVVESDPNGRSPHESGSKLDAGKPEAFRGLIQSFPRAIIAVASVSTFGANKYTWGGWRTVPEGFERYSNAMVRHLAKEGEGEIEDNDSHLLHAAHVAWNSLARLEILLEQQQKVAKQARLAKSSSLTDDINKLFSNTKGINDKV